MDTIKNVWFVSHYSMPPEYEMRNKTEMYDKYLSQKGIKCKIFAASTVHNADVNLITDGSLYIEKNYDGIEFVHIRCSNYKGNGLKRVINMQQFGHRFKKVAKHFIITSGHLFFLGKIIFICLQPFEN